MADQLGAFVEFVEVCPELESGRGVPRPTLRLAGAPEDPRLLEEGHLNDPKLRETFVERVLAYRRWRDLVATGSGAAELVEFHRVHEYLLLAHRPEHDSLAELQRTLDDYRRGLVPLVVPLTLLRHHVRALGIAYLAEQVYLEPHPKELMLRNHV